MKVAILTQPLGTNYGGMLQAFALQKVLRDQGHEVVTVDRQFAKRSIVRRFLSFFKYHLFNAFGKEQPLRATTEVKKQVLINNFEFINKNINMSELITSNEDMDKYFDINAYDVIVVGSDQTWRPKYSPNIFNYYLDFAVENKALKVAYASSFGVDEWEYTEEETNKCRELIKQFDFISVREDSGVALCRDHLGSSASYVLDPTLLLDSNDYRQLWLNDKDVDDQEFGSVFSYILDKTEYKSQVVQSVTTHLNKTSFTCQPVRSFKQSYRGDISDFVFPSPVKWVKSFAASSFVITDSFHGCVFSIIFNKPFIVIGNKSRGLARFHSLLNRFGLSGRLIEEGDYSYESVLTKEINWPAVNKILKEERERSIGLLFDSIKEVTPPLR